MRRLLLALVCAASLAAVARAEDRGLPEWAARALARGRSAAVALPVAPSGGVPMTVAGVRGSAVITAPYLYWKDADSSPAELVAEAEAKEVAGQDSQAHALFLGALRAGASGHSAERADLGLAVLMLRRGQVAAAQARLRALVARAGDADQKYAAALPLAVSLAATARVDEAVSILQGLLAEAPDHALAGQADALLWMIRDGAHQTPR